MGAEIKVQENAEENLDATAPQEPINNGSSQDVDGLESDKNNEVYYDAKKSFFDNISCEATEIKQSDNGQRMSRFQERKLNSETFGIPEHPNYRGRGRGGYRGRGRGGYGYNNYNNQGGYNNYNRNN